jgi:hypothetical protein
MYRTEIATQNELARWNEIVSRCPYSEALHTAEWRNALTACFKQLRPLYLIIKDNNDNAVGALPCFVFKPIPFVKTLLSMPWTLPGGPLIFPGTNIAEAASSAIEKLDEISQKQRSYETTVTLSPACYPEVSDRFEFAGYLREPDHFTHFLQTDVDYDEIWKAYKKRVRGAVRKARKLGVTVRETEDEADLRTFYRLYLAAMKSFSSTPKPYSLFRYLQTSPIARFVVAEVNDQITGGVLFLHFNYSVRMWCGASDPNFLSYRPNNAIIDYIVQWSCKNNYPCVDFGATPPEREDLVAFKEGWRAERAWFYTFTKLHSSRKKKLWTISEPALRRVYAAIQRLRIRSI